jgi:hypothetical protein
MGKRRGAYSVLVGKLEKETQLGRTRHRCEYNIKTDFNETGRRASTGLIWFRIETGGGLL